MHYCFARNKETTPVYEQWSVTFSLVSNTSTVVAQWTSGINIRTLLPAIAVSFVDKFDVSRVQPGKYSLRLQIVDPTNFNKPLGLAIRGASTNNVYTFQSIQLNAASPSPTEYPRDVDPVANWIALLRAKARMATSYQVLWFTLSQFRAS